MVGDRFGEIGVWASVITESVMDSPPAAGGVRTCQVAGFGPIAPGLTQERLTKFDPEARSLAYEATAGMPWFISSAVSRWSVHSGPGIGCTVRVHAMLALRPVARAISPVMRWRLRAASRKTLAELRHHVETGLPRPARPDPPVTVERPR